MFGSWFKSYRKRYQNWVKKAKNLILCNFLLIFSKNWPYYINPFFDNRYFSSWPIPRKNERRTSKKSGWGQKLIKNLTFWKKLTSVTSDFFRRAHGGLTFFPYESAIKNYKKSAAGMKKQHCAKTAFPQPT